MPQTARGPFEVKLSPQQDTVGDPSIARLALDKVFHGDLEATSKGQMLAVRSAVPGSAGYVAMERVEGTLHGRRGSFALQHSGTMDRGIQGLVISVVPDSGTGELVGLEGILSIHIAEGGAHRYAFTYSLRKR